MRAGWVLILLTAGALAGGCAVFNSKAGAKRLELLPVGQYCELDLGKVFPHVSAKCTGKIVKVDASEITLEDAERTSHFEVLIGAGTNISERLSDGISFSQEQIQSVKLLSDEEVTAWRTRVEARLQAQSKLDGNRS